MNFSIWKYPVRVDDEITVRMPEGAEILCVQVQRGEPCIWALVDPTKKEKVYTFHWYGTGHPIESAGSYIGTVQLEGGDLIFHLFLDS